MVSRRCTALCLDGTPCRAWAMRGTEPPRCASHGGTEWAAAAKLGKRSILDCPDHASRDLPDDCDIDAVIDLLYRRERLLDDLLDQIWGPDVAVRDLANLLRIHGQNAGRLGRLLRDRQALSGEAADGISGAIAQALDELSSELGAEL